MPKSFRSISGKSMVKLIGKVGFFEVSQKGSHIKVKRVENSETDVVIIPNHKELTPGTFRSILKMAGLSLEEFDKINK